MASYPMYLPGRPVDDKILIFEDTDGDGRADKQTVFADKLHVPTGIELGDGGVYVSQQPNLMFLKDTDGDDKADQRSLILHGFDTADSHHAMHAFTWDPGGALYWQEGTFHRTQVETPYGPQRVRDAAVFRFEPKTLEVRHLRVLPVRQPLGPHLRQVGAGLRRRRLGRVELLRHRVLGRRRLPGNKHSRACRSSSRCSGGRPPGCEFVSSRHFPEDTQGDYLLNNVIGFQGVLRYRVKEQGSGFHADPVEPLLRV